jgi:tRNA-specific 2-thiouridylase
MADVHWIAGPPERAELHARIRHGPRLEPCVIRPLADGRWKVILQTSDPGIAPGQSAILYEGEICLGGGVIE